MYHFNHIIGLSASQVLFPPLKISNKPTFKVFVLTHYAVKNQLYCIHFFESQFTLILLSYIQVQILHPACYLNAN